MAARISFSIRFPRNGIRLAPKVWVCSFRAIGATAVEALRAQAKPPVYFIGQIEVTNREGYTKEYLPKAREIIKEHGGQLVESGGAGSDNPIIAVGGEPPKRVVIYRYPNADAVHAWRTDPAYEKVRKVGRNLRNITPSPWWATVAPRQ